MPNVDYRPIGDPRWYQKENPPGTPEPLVDIGDCSVINGEVSCTKHTLSTLAPTLEKVSGADDMYRRWQRLMELHPKTQSSVMRKQGDIVHEEL